MKKLSAIFAMTALLFAGCSKSDMQRTAADEGIDVLQNVTFTAAVPDQSATQTKATFTPKSDGNAASVNRCIMEIYYNNKVYKRMYAPVDKTTKKASFTVKLPANRTYDILFWADNVEDASTEGGLTDDRYYNTGNVDNDGLKKVSILGTYAGNNDERDAFFGYRSCTVEQGGSSFPDITLKRPFSQINVITTDVKSFKTAPDAIPSSVTVTLVKPYTAINVMTGELSGNNADLEYSASLYDFPDPEQYDLSEIDQAKLSMDYVFATSTQGAIDMVWKAAMETDIVHQLTNIPYQRNYRTNIKGDLLTSSGSWTVTVDPNWDQNSPIDWKVVSTTVDDIAGMNGFISANPDADEYNVTFSQAPNDGGKPGTDPGAHSMLTTNLGEGKVLNVNVESQTKTLYIGDYENENSITITTGQVHAGKVNINVPDGKSIETLIIDAASKSVYLNDAKIENCGTLTNVQASTSANTLVIEKGQTISNLTVLEGGLEIHGTVTTLTIAPKEGKSVKVRTSENLYAGVFAAIKGEGHDYIDRPLYCEKKNGEMWDIIPSVCVIGPAAAPTKGFSSLEDAFKSDEAAGQTITLVSDVELTSEILVNKSIVLDMNGHSINSGNVSAFQVFGGSLDIEGEGKIYGTPANYKEVWVKGSTSSSATDFSVLKIGQEVTVSCENGYCLMISQNNGCAFGTKITIDGQVEGYYGALYVNGAINKTEGNIPEVTVNGALATNEGSAALYAAGYAKYVINSTASAVGGDALYLCGGETVINGGAFVGNGPKVAYNPNITSGYEPTGDALVVVKRNGYPAMSVSVKGGSFKSFNAEAVASYSDVEGQELKNFITGGVYSTKPAGTLANELYLVIYNQDVSTKADFPYAVSLFPLPGSGTETDPYQICSVDDIKIMRIMMSESPAEKKFFAMASDIEVSEDDALSVPIYGRSLKNVDVIIPVFKNGEFDGAGHTLTFTDADNMYFFGDVQNATVKNLKFYFDSSKDASIAYKGANNVLESVETEGNIKWSSGNCGAFLIYIYGNQTMKDCKNSATLQTHTGDVTMYDAVFFGYAVESADIKMTDCSNEGSLMAGKAGMFLANWSYGAYTHFILSNCKNNGIIRTFSTDPTWKDYNYLTSGYWDKAAYVTFTINQETYSVYTTPKWYQLEAQGGVVGTGSFERGSDPKLALSLNEDKTFTVTPSETQASYYVVSVGTYAGTATGSTRVYATEQITGTATTLKYLSFVDDAWLTANSTAVAGELAGNVIYTLGDESHYYVGEGNLLGGEVHAPEMVSVTAYDGNDVIIASAPLSAN